MIHLLIILAHLTHLYKKIKKIIEKMTNLSTLFLNKL